MHIKYRIAGKFGELTCLNIWRKNVWRVNRSANRLLIVSTNLDGLVWRIADDLPNLPNFPPAKLSCYKVVTSVYLISLQK